MRVSVVCIADRHDRLPLLYWSLVAQTHRDWELIVLDQSVSGFVTRWLPHNGVGKVLVKHVDRIGDWGQTAKEAAANQLHDTDVFMFPNDDAYYVPTALAEMVAVIADGADIAVCGWLYDSMGYTPWPPSTHEGRVDVGGFMVTRSVFQRVGWKDKSQTGDAKLIADCIKAGARLGVCRGTLYVKN